MAATCTSLQSPPRAVLTPRAARARAIPHTGDAVRLYLVMIGRTLAANASASSALEGGSPGCVEARAFHRLDIGQAFQV